MVVLELVTCKKLQNYLWCAHPPPYPPGIGVAHPSLCELLGLSTFCFRLTTCQVALEMGVIKLFFFKSSVPPPNLLPPNVREGG